jgi:hypothetical protein
MSEQGPPYPPPLGKLWTKSWFGLGQWTLVDDPAHPLPPPGHRVVHNFWTGRPELQAVVGQGVDFFADGREVRVPNTGPPSRVYSFAKPDPSKISKGIEFTGPSSGDQDIPQARRLGPGGRYRENVNGAAIF